MKTAILISCIVAGGSLMLKNTETTMKATKSLPAVTSSKSKRNISSGSLPKGPIRIVVDKSSYELYVYDAEGWYATYPVVFGNNTLDDKKMEGNKNTPEGTFKIVNKRVHEKWDRYMGLDYPTKESLAKFNERKKRGEVPANASHGGGIGIHGTWPRDDYFIDKYKNWTNGCISLKNDDVEDLYSYVPIGTPITIRK
jgi:lipoprotein-anchoring transpeptidase ErfK/SrfK